MADHARLLGDAPVRSLDEWLQGDGGLGYAHALDLEPDEVIDQLDASGLRGRGGAGFPTGTKWRGVHEASGAAGGPCYVVCNAAEGEPGTYKDRSLMEQNPYAVLEGVLIAMHVMDAEQGFIGVKEKFTHAVERLVAARDEMVQAGWRDANRVVIALGPDEYLFGEEKAMLEVIEGRLPLPRILPPYEQGLFGSTAQASNPSLVNNVESFSHVARILAHGPDWFREEGTDSSPGTMLFTVVGDAENPGVYELPMGTPLRTLLVDIAGVDPDDVKAIYSGTSNTVITPDQLDTPLDFDAFGEAGTGLGSGGFIVYDASRCIVKALTVLQRFLAVESCGQCNACVLGTAEIWENLARIEAGEGTTDDLDRIVQVTPTIIDGQRCYLPTGSQLMVGSTIETFWEEFVAHLGTPCPDDRELPTPLIERIDEQTGEVDWHPSYHRKRLDWSYAEPTGSQV